MITKDSAPGASKPWPSRPCGSSGRTTPCGATFPYEYEFERLAIDLINGSELLRDWVDDPDATQGNLDALAGSGKAEWREERAEVLLYPSD